MKSHKKRLAEIAVRSKHGSSVQPEPSKDYFRFAENKKVIHALDQASKPLLQSHLQK